MYLFSWVLTLAAINFSPDLTKIDLISSSSAGYPFGKSLVNLRLINYPSLLCTAIEFMIVIPLKDFSPNLTLETLS